MLTMNWTVSNGKATEEDSYPFFNVLNFEPIIRQFDG
jgi:hypothetical protein